MELLHFKRKENEQIYSIWFYNTINKNNLSYLEEVCFLVKLHEQLTYLKCKKYPHT